MNVSQNEILNINTNVINNQIPEAQNRVKSELLKEEETMLGSTGSGKTTEEKLPSDSGVRKGGLKKLLKNSKQVFDPASMVD